MSLAQEVYLDMKDEEYSFSGILRKKTFGAYDAATGSKEVTNTDSQCYGIFKKISDFKSIPKYYELKEGDKMCLVAVNGIEPEVKDQLIVGTKVYDIKMSNETTVGTNALFTLIIR